MVISRDDDRVGLVKAYVCELGTLDYLLFAQRLVLVLRKVEYVNLRYGKGGKVEQMRCFQVRSVKKNDRGSEKHEEKEVMP